jgi:hypothetical protein
VREVNEQRKEGLIKRVRPHAEWEAIRFIALWGWSLIAPLIGGVVERAAHLPLNWGLIGGLFCAGVLVAILGSLADSKSREKSDQRLDERFKRLEEERRSPEISFQEQKNSRLKIIEARYGVEGGPDPEVYEEYLKPRIHGDALVGWVGADLFGGYQPVTGLPKRLRVRYSFDGKEATVERPEQAMIVLPEDRFLKQEIERLTRVAAVAPLAEESISSSTVSESDPLVYLEFTDARATTTSDHKENQAYFTLVNRGQTEARNVILEPIEMDGKIVQFTRHRIAAVLLPKREGYFYPDVVTMENKSVTERERDLFHLFCLDYIALGDSTICEATKEVVATYQDAARNLFEVTCELVFDPSAHNAVRMGNRGPSPAIFTRNHKFRRVASAISSTA